jgi:HlyD family secretion protein
MTQAERKNNKLLWGLLGAVALLIAFAVYKNRTQQKGIAVELEKAEKRTIKETVSASGKVFPEKEVKISSDVSGEIVELFVQEGDSVKQGQLLVRIDPDAYQSAVDRGRASVDNSKANMANADAAVKSSKAQVLQAKAEIERIKAQIENTQAIHTRNTKLFQDGVISEADFQASQSNLRTLEANLSSANASLQAAEANLESSKQQVAAASFTVKSQEATLQEMQTNLRRTTIYAPDNGIISMLNVEQGERVVGTAQMSGTEIMRLSNLDVMEVQVDVSETDVLRVALGDEASIEVDAYIDRKFKGVVTEIANSASGTGSATLTSDQVTNFVVRIRIDPNSYSDLISINKPYPFRPGMSASVDITTETKTNVLSVPIQAVTTREKDDGKGKDKDDDDKDAEKETKKKDSDEEDVIEVIFLSENGKAKMVEVKTGIQDDDYIEVLQGITEGDMVVKGPFSAVSKKLKDGKQIYEEKEKEKKKEDEEEE